MALRAAGKKVTGNITFGRSNNTKKLNPIILKKFNERLMSVMQPTKAFCEQRYKDSPTLLYGILPDESGHKSLLFPCWSHVLVPKNFGGALGLGVFSYNRNA